MQHKIMRLLVITLGIIFFDSCNEHSSNNPTAPSTTNSVCIEGATTAINGDSYVCRNDSFVPINSNGSNITSRSSSSCSTDYTITITPRSSSSLAINHDGYKGTVNDTRNGISYKTVGIGSQIWMAENLNFKTDSSWCYDNLQEKCEKYGRLYKWTDVVKLPPSYIDSIIDIEGIFQGICPTGWHIPSSSEFKAMVDYVINSEKTYDVTDAGSLFSSATGWFRDQNGIDSFGFDARPSGWRDDKGTFVAELHTATFWTTSDQGYYYMTQPNYYFIGHPIGNREMKYYARALRCVKND